MGEHGLGRGGIMAKLLAAWDKTVGAGIAKHALPESIKGGILTVTVDSPVWMHQLSMMAPGLIEKINSVMGDGHRHGHKVPLRQACTPGRESDKEGKVHTQEEEAPAAGA